MNDSDREFTQQLRTALMAFEQDYKTQIRELSLTIRQLEEEVLNMTSSTNSSYIPNELKERMNDQQKQSPCFKCTSAMWYSNEGQTDQYGHPLANLNCQKNYSIEFAPQHCSAKTEG